MVADVFTLSIVGYVPLLLLILCMAIRKDKDDS